jgi:flavin-dependent dehydrogenase
MGDGDVGQGGAPGAALAGEYDVAILGGGLAALTLAIQLKNARPDTSIVVAEKREWPVREAAFKVGESTVECSAHYFADVIGMKDHIESDQLPKCGLRFWFPAGDNSDITRRVEWGTPFFPPVHSYQLDRGRFENELAERAKAAGADVRGGYRVEDVDLSQEGHTVTLSRDGETHQVRARWVVDAAGRAFILQRKLGLQKEAPHKIGSSWLRLAGGLDIETFSDDSSWLERMPERGLRKQSTNHLMGEGYWVWLIPLSSGSISIGIVADPRFHPFDQISTLDGAIEWLKKHEPNVGEAIDSRRDDVEDFLGIETFSHDAEQVYSADRWALTGEAGVFVDPLYSPGSDYIALSNTYVTDLIKRDLDGEDIAERAEKFNQAYLDAFHNVIESGYLDHYAEFGNVAVMQAKLVWDYVTYWSLTALRFFYEKNTDLEYMAQVEPHLDRGWRLSRRVQQLFRDWNRVERREFPGVFVNAAAFPGLVQRHLDLGADLDEETLRARFKENSDMLEALAVVIFHKAAEALPDGAPGPDRKINPYAISLDPSRWEQDGLFDGSGLSLEEARRLTEGVENMWVDELAKAA